MRVKRLQKKPNAYSSRSATGSRGSATGRTDSEALPDRTKPAPAAETPTEVSGLPGPGDPTTASGGATSVDLCSPLSGRPVLDRECSIDWNSKEPSLEAASHESGAGSRTTDSLPELRAAEPGTSSEQRCGTSGPLWDFRPRTSRSEVPHGDISGWQTRCQVLPWPGLGASSRSEVPQPTGFGTPKRSEIPRLGCPAGPGARAHDRHHGAVTSLRHGDGRQPSCDDRAPWFRRCDDRAPSCDGRAPWFRRCDDRAPSAVGRGRRCDDRAPSVVGRGRRCDDRAPRCDGRAPWFRRCDERAPPAYPERSASSPERSAASPAPSAAAFSAHANGGRDGSPPIRHACSAW